jgi:hypothetical protein
VLDRWDEVLAVIGPGWVGAPDAGGGRRFAGGDDVHLVARAPAAGVGDRRRGGRGGRSGRGGGGVAARRPPTVGSYLFLNLVARRELPPSCFGADDDTIDPSRVDAVTVGFDIPCAPTAGVSVEVATDAEAGHPIVDRAPSGTC